MSEVHGGYTGAHAAPQNRIESMPRNRSDGRTWRAYARAEDRWNPLRGRLPVTGLLGILVVLGMSQSFKNAVISNLVSKTSASVTSEGVSVLYDSIEDKHLSLFATPFARQAFIFRPSDLTDREWFRFDLNRLCSRPIRNFWKRINNVNASTLFSYPCRSLAVILADDASSKSSIFCNDISDSSAHSFSIKYRASPRYGLDLYHYPRAAIIYETLGLFFDIGQSLQTDISGNDTNNDKRPSGPSHIPPRRFL